MTKPEFPKPRLIREGFMPERNCMRKYRIKQIIRGDEYFYYPQEKVLGLLWINISLFGEYFSEFGCCESFLKSHIKSKQKAIVDYFYYGND